MNKYEIRTKKKKDAIINAALTLFREKGYTNVSILEIASYSGVSSVSIYNYFENKEGLVAECANALLKETIEMAQDLIAQRISFKEKLLQIIAICADKNKQLLGEYFSSEALSDKVLVDLYNDNTNKIRMKLLHDLIESGKEEGSIDRSVSTETIMEYLKVLEEVHMTWVTNNDYEKRVSDLYRLVLYGLIGH